MKRNKSFPSKRRFCIDGYGILSIICVFVFYIAFIMFACYGNQESSWFEIVTEFLLLATSFPFMLAAFDIIFLSVAYNIIMRKIKSLNDDGKYTSDFFENQYRRRVKYRLIFLSFKGTYLFEIKDNIYFLNEHGCFKLPDEMKNNIDKKALKSFETIEQQLMTPFFAQKLKEGNFCNSNKETNSVIKYMKNGKVILYTNGCWSLHSESLFNLYSVHFDITEEEAESVINGKLDINNLYEQYYQSVLTNEENIYANNIQEEANVHEEHQSEI